MMMPTTLMPSNQQQPSTSSPVQISMEVGTPLPPPHLQSPTPPLTPPPPPPPNPSPPLSPVKKMPLKEPSSEASITSPILGVEDSNKGVETNDDCMEFSVILKKPPGAHNCGLGLTIVGYVSEKDKDKGMWKWFLVLLLLVF